MLPDADCHWLLLTFQTTVVHCRIITLYISQIDVCWDLGGSLNSELKSFCFRYLCLAQYWANISWNNFAVSSTLKEGTQTYCLPSFPTDTNVQSNFSWSWCCSREKFNLEDEFNTFTNNSKFPNLYFIISINSLCFCFLLFYLFRALFSKFQVKI